MQSKIFKILTFFLVFIFLAFSEHKFYVSLVQLDHNEKDTLLEITMKIFTDDLENALEVQSGLLLKLGTQHELPESDSILVNYISDNFKLKLNGQDLIINYLGKEVDLDVTWCYLEVSGVEFIEKMEIIDKMLTEIFEDQSNLIKVKYKGKESAALLNRSRQMDVIKF